jgi:hypothetical protein
MDREMIEHGPDCYPWTKCFVLLPRKSVTGKILFFKWAFRRRVWWAGGLHMEPEVQYADIFEILTLDD